MLQFLAGLVVGLVVAALVWRNNKVKFAATVEAGVQAALKAKSKL